MEKFLAKIFFLLILSSLLLTACSSAKSAKPSKAKIEKQSIGETLAANNHLPIAARIALYHRLKKESPNAYKFESEEELNIYGYSLLQKRLPAEAIEIFKLNVEQFPESANVYDSLADGYLELGDKERAKINRTKSEEMLSLLDADPAWGREIFHMPLGFAPQIAFRGIEEARFAPGWGDSTHTHFWTYAFAWEIDMKRQPSTEDLENYMQYYFDGLMEGRNGKDESTPKTTAEFKVSSTPKGRYIGKLEIFDGFRTKRQLVLNVIIDYAFCKKKKQSQIIFRFSPKEIGHAVWSELEAIRFKEGSCKGRG